MASDGPRSSFALGRELMKTSIRFALCVAALAAASPAFAAIDSISLLASGQHSYSDNDGNALFSLTDIQPAGSGIFGPIVRIKRDNSEQGYNVDFDFTNDKSTLDVVPIDHSPVTNPVV